MIARSLVVLVAAAASLIAAPARPQALTIQPNDGFAGLSLRVSDESAPAGSIVQIKIDVTEPKPISTGKGTIKVKGISTIQGISLMNRGQDSFGLALVDGEDLRFVIASPAGLFGTTADYPIVTVAGTVAPGAAPGTTFPLTFGADALHFIGPSGSTYPLELTDGRLTVANSVTIGDVSPGSSVVPAGGVVQIRGTNFTPSTRLQFSETSVAETRYINSQRIDVVLAQTTDMRGLRIRAKNPDNSQSTYFAYERTRPLSVSSDSILAKSVPLFAATSATTSILRFAQTPGRRRAVGHGAAASAVRPAPINAFAIQNLNGSSITAQLELLDSAGHTYAVNSVSIGPDQYLVRSIAEQFGIVAAPAALRITSNAPLHTLGIVADHFDDSAYAIPPG
jgi:hypothetical protein